jgi:hypothetical protein
MGLPEEASTRASLLDLGTARMVEEEGGKEVSCKERGKDGLARSLLFWAVVAMVEVS